MEFIKLEIKKRNRQYGIITWSLAEKSLVEKFFKNVASVDIEFHDKIYLNRKVDYKYRRISFGKKRMESIENDFVILKIKNNNLKIN